MLRETRFENVALVHNTTRTVVYRIYTYIHVIKESLDHSVYSRNIRSANIQGWFFGATFYESTCSEMSLSTAARSISNKQLKEGKGVLSFVYFLVRYKVLHLDCKHV